MGERRCDGARLRPFRRTHSGLWITSCRTRSSILPLPAAPAAFRFDRRHSLEAHLPAQRPPPQAQARLPRAHVDARRAGDPEAPQRQGPQAALRLSPPDYPRSVQRRNRLSRSRDFDAVYRSGRSASTRFLVLYWFPREDDERTSRGSAWPCRSPSETRSCATGSSASCARRGASCSSGARPATTTCSSRARARRAGGHARARLARRARVERGARSGRRRPPGSEGSRVKYLGIGARLRLALHVRAPDARRHLQVPPELLAVRARRAPQARARRRARRRPPGACSAATRGATAGSTPA